MMQLREELFYHLQLSLTRCEDEKHFLSQMMEMHRTRLPHPRESAAFGTRTLHQMNSDLNEH